MFLISCETGGRRAPAQWLQSHSGATSLSLTSDALSCDRSGRYAARRLALNLAAPLIENPYSIDCVDVSRSTHHRQLFSSASRALSQIERQQLLDKIYFPYRERVRQAIISGLKRGTYLVHLSVRSCSASSKGQMRRTDVGLLYDPACEDEVDFCLDWIDELWEIAPMLRVRRNYPRRGTQDSLTRAMRSEFAVQAYLGIEVLLNRAWAGRSTKIRDEAIDGLSTALREIFSDEFAEVA